VDQEREEAVPSGSRVGNCYRLNRHQESLRFLRDIETSPPASFDIHFVPDSYGYTQGRKAASLAGATSSLSCSFGRASRVCSSWWSACLQK
jgi:hypothetical protein